MSAAPPLRLLIPLILAGLLIGLDTAPLWDQDEAAYAGFAHQMRASGDWRLPSFAWSEVHRKPPLHFWMIAGAFELLGERLGAVRLPGVLAVLSSGALVAWWGAPVFGRTRARHAALILLTTLAMVIGKIGLTDGPLLLAQTAAALALLNHLHSPRLRWCIALWIAVAAGLLLKGPPILILTLGMSGVLLLHPDRVRLLLPLLGLPLAALPLLAWGWWAWSADGGETIRWMIDWYILSRARGGTALGQTGPPGFYLLTMVVLLFPWTALLPGALVGMVQRRDREALLLAAWMAAGWWAYELIPSKLPSYVLGAYPALALAMTRPSESAWTQTVGNGLAVVVGLALSGVLIGAALVDGEPGIAVPGLALIGLGAAAVWRPAARFSLAPVTLALIWLLALPGLRPRLFLTADVAEAAIATGQPVQLARNYQLPSLPYYLSAAGVPWSMLETTPLPGHTLITDGDDPPPGAAIFDGHIPDKGRPIRFWVVP